MTIFFWQSLLGWADEKRIKIKKFIFFFVLVDIVLLTLVELAIVSSRQQWMDPAVVIVGIIWIALTVFIAYSKGGVAGDIIIAAWVDGKAKPIDFFMLIQALIVIFFYFVPAWECWSAAWIFIVLIWAITLTGNILSTKIDWKPWRKVFIFIAIILISSLFIKAGYRFFVQRPLDAATFRNGVNGEARKVWGDIFGKKPKAQRDPSNYTPQVQEKTFDLAPHEKRNTWLNFNNGYQIHYWQMPGKYFFIKDERYKDGQKVEGSPSFTARSDGTVVIENGPEPNRIKVRVSPS